MYKIEEMVCFLANTLIPHKDMYDVTPNDVYIGKKNIPLVRAVARNFIFNILHNSFGFSYSVIAQRSDMTRDSVIRCVRKCISSLAMYDNIYTKMKEETDKKLKEMYGE